MVKSNPEATAPRSGPITIHHQYLPVWVMTPPETMAPTTVIIMKGRISIPDFVAEWP